MSTAVKVGFRAIGSCPYSIEAPPNETIFVGGDSNALAYPKGPSIVATIFPALVRGSKAGGIAHLASPVNPDEEPFDRMLDYFEQTKTDDSKYIIFLSGGANKSPNGSPSLLQTPELILEQFGAIGITGANIEIEEVDPHTPLTGVRLDVCVGAVSYTTENPALLPGPMADDRDWPSDELMNLGY